MTFLQCPCVFASFVDIFRNILAISRVLLTYFKNVNKKRENLKFPIFLRKQRDRLSNGMHHQSVTSTSETGGSELEDEYCSPVDVCLACMPMETLRCCTCQGRTSNSSKTHRQLWLHALILFVFAVALAGLAYYSMTLQNQLAVLSMHLDPGKIPAFWLSSQSQKSLP